MDDPVPLTTLLSWAWISFVIEADNTFESSRTADGRTARIISQVMWANGLRCLDDAGVTVQEARMRARAGCNIGGLERWRWITVGHEGRRRTGYGSMRGVRPETVLRPTVAGSEARRQWPDVVNEVEESWLERFGPEKVGRLRAALDSYDPAMPWSPPEVHPSDGFFVHVVESAGTPTAPGSDDTSLMVLMGQTLTRLTLAWETHSPASLPVAANALRLLGSGAVGIRDLPAAAGISKEAAAMLVGFLVRKGLAERMDGGRLMLTESGRVALERRHVHEPGHERLRLALLDILGQTESLGLGLTPPDGNWRAQRPYLRATARMLAGLPSTLPWHPMVLHRGGWPDGS